MWAMMISSKDDYAEVLSYLNRRDTLRNSHRLPLEMYSLSGNAFFFTICAQKSSTPFVDDMRAKAIVDALLWRKQKHGWQLFCYCLMPDHLHFILQLPDAEERARSGGIRGAETENVLHHIADFKSYTTSQIWWKSGGAGQLWQESSYDRVITYDNSISPVISYVLNNPVRKGLVNEWDRYPYSGIIDQW